MRAYLRQKAPAESSQDAQRDERWLPAHHRTVVRVVEFVGIVFSGWAMAEKPARRPGS
jgi:hypothetical protein